VSASPNAPWTQKDLDAFANLQPRAQTAYYGSARGGFNRIQLITTWYRHRANLPEAVALCNGDANVCKSVLKQPVETWCHANPDACRELAQKPNFAEAARTIGADVSPPREKGTGPFKSK
jgi:hypothetical protein